MPFAAVPPEIRRDLGKYRLIAEIGRGGMGVVYLAVLRGLDGFRKLVVIKELRPEFLGTDASVTMFMHEARVAGRLNHPNIVQTIEVGADGPRRFIAMEYLDGQPLHQLVQRALAQSNRLPLRMHLGILVDVLSALEYAHDSTDFDGTPLGVIHRDVSPHNVIVTYEGQTKLVDFGISRTAAVPVEEEGDGGLEGKMRYMAPEQAAGGRVDRRANLFSVGAMLWEAVVGQRPWEGQSDEEVFENLIGGAIPRVRDAWPDVDPELAAIVERAMSVELNARYATAAEMRGDLERYIGARNLTPTARSLGGSVSRLFADDRAHRRALIDGQLRLLNDAAEARGSTTSRAKLGMAAPPPFREETLHSPTGHGTSPPSSSPGSALSLPPPAEPRSGRPLVLLRGLGRGRSQSATPFIAAAAFGAALVIAAVWADRMRWSAVPVLTASAAASMPAAAASMPAPAAPTDSTPRPAHASISVFPAFARLYLDDVAVPNPYVVDHARDTTAHRLRVEAAGYETKARAFTFAEDIELEIHLSPDSAAQPPPALAVPKHPVSARPSTPSTTTMCEPPFTVDGSGKKHWKLDCFDGDAPGPSTDQAGQGPPRLPVQPKPIDTGSPYP